jgi:hypothetical protein
MPNPPVIVKYRQRCHGAQAPVRACILLEKLPSSGSAAGWGPRGRHLHHVTHMTGIPSWPSSEATAGTRRPAPEPTRAHATGVTHSTRTVVGLRRPHSSPHHPARVALRPADVGVDAHLTCGGYTNRAKLTRAHQLSAANTCPRDVAMPFAHLARATSPSLPVACHGCGY